MMKTRDLLFLLILFYGGSIYAQFENKYSIFFSDLPCVENKEQFELFYPIREEDEEVRCIIKFDRELLKKIYIEEDLIDNLTPYLFTNLQEKKEYELKLLLVNDNEINYTLIFTPLPLVCIDTKGNEVDREEKVPCEIVVFDPYGRTNEKEYLFSHTAGIRIRGQFSATYPKKSYGIELWDSAGEEVDATLLGMRSDGDWILDAMYSDYSCMRNRLCMDIWNSFNNVPHIVEEPEAINGTHGEFVEVFLDGSYHGLYCFSDRVDRKQLKLKKGAGTGGILYKGRERTDTTTFISYEDWPDEDDLEWDSWSSEYPAIAGYSRFDLLAGLIDFLDRVEEGQEPFFDEFVHMDNMLDYLLFNSIICAVDNHGNNIFLGVYDQTKDQRLFLTPWDLDATFGRSWDGELLNQFAFKENTLGKLGINRLFSLIWEYPSKEHLVYLKKRWDELKGDQLSCETINVRIDEYRDMHLNSGAWKREKSLWPEFCEDLIEETNFMKEWYAESFSITDAYLNHYLWDKFNAALTSISQSEFFDIYVQSNLVFIGNGIEENSLIEVMDITGKCVLSYKYNDSLSTFTLSEMGIYIIRVTGNSTSFTRKILIKNN